jgi:hypothetical protein
MYHVMLNYQVAIRFLAIECFSNVFDFNRLFVSKIYSRGAKVAPPLDPFASPATPRSPQCRRSPSVAHASGKEFCHHCFARSTLPPMLHRNPRRMPPPPKARSQGCNPFFHARPKHHPPLMSVRRPHRSIHPETTLMSFTMFSSSSRSKLHTKWCPEAPGAPFVAKPL